MYNKRFLASFVIGHVAKRLITEQKTETNRQIDRPSPGGANIWL